MGSDVASFLWTVTGALFPVYALVWLIRGEYKSPGARYWGFAFSVYGLGQMLALFNCGTPLWARLVMAAGSFVCTASGGAHLVGPAGRLKELSRPLGRSR